MSFRFKLKSSGGVFDTIALAAKETAKHKAIKVAEIATDKAIDQTPVGKVFSAVQNSAQNFIIQASGPIGQTYTAVMTSASVVTASVVLPVVTAEFTKELAPEMYKQVETFVIDSLPVELVEKIKEEIKEIEVKEDIKEEEIPHPVEEPKEEVVIEDEEELVVEEIKEELKTYTEGTLIDELNKFLCK